MPRSLLWIQTLQWFQVGLTSLYVVTVLSMVSYVNGELLGVLLYDALPSVVGVVLARGAARGGVWVARGLVAVQCWLVWLSFVSLLHLDYRGFTQAFIPIVVLVLLRRPEVRDWFALPVGEREAPRTFRVERMILWRRDRGQTALEYLGLVLVVAAIIGGLVATGIGQELTGKISAQVCRIGGGGDCGEGGGDAGAGDPSKTGDAGGGTGPGGGTGSGGETGDAGTSGAGGTGGTGGAGDTSDVVIVSGDGDTHPVAPGPLEREVDNDDFKDDPDEPLIPGERHDRSWWDHTRGFVVAPFTGLVNDTYAVITNPKKVATDSWNGLKTYSQDWWKKKGGSVSDKWKRGDKLGATWDGAKKGLSFTKDFAIDMFVDKENWKKGNYGAASGNTILGLVGIFSPKTFKKFTKLGKTKKLHFPNTPVGRAAEAADKAKKAAEKGDLDAAAKYADKAQKAADEAADKARKGQKKACKNIAMPQTRVPFADFSRVGAGAGATTSAVYHGSPSLVGALRAGTSSCGPDDDDVKASREAQQKALDARADVLREAMKRAKQDGAKQFDPQALERLLKRAEDSPDSGKNGISKKDAADAIEEVTTMLRQKNIDGKSRGSLTGKTLDSKQGTELAEKLAEVKAVRRAAESEAAEGTKVYASIGTEGGRAKVDLGQGDVLDVSGIPDADVAYRGRDGMDHLVEVKNTGGGTTKFEIHQQIERLGRWQRERPPGAPARAARYEIDSQNGWEKIFLDFQPKKMSAAQKRAGAEPPRVEGSPASKMADEGVGARVAGQDLSARQLREMDQAWRGKSRAERDAAIGSGKMKTPAAALEYLGVS